jgi:hypothetical protein
MRLIWLAAVLVASIGLAAESDAFAITDNIRARHAPYGAILDPIFVAPDSEELLTYTRCGDSALWTGHFLAAESFRYKVTRSAEALDNVMVALHGIRTLLDATGSDLLARCAFPENSPWAADLISQEREHGARTGIVDGEKWIWIGDTSRDQYLGVFFGMTVAWDYVDDPRAREAVRWLTVRMLRKLQGDAWLVRDPGGVSTTFLGRADQRLMLLKLGRRLDPDHFTNSYRIQANLVSAESIVSAGIDAVEEHGSYFKFNLGHVTYFGLLTSGDNSWIRNNYESAWRVLRRATAGHGNAFFNLIARAIDGPAEPRDVETRRLLKEWLARPRRDFFVDNRGLYRACGDNRACDPLPINARVTTDFLWQRSPFQLSGGGSGRVENPGIDYILPYWMARYYGVVEE